MSTMTTLSSLVASLRETRTPAPPEPFSSHHGLPIPWRQGDALVLAVLCCDAIVSAERGLVLSSPVHLALYAPASGERLELRPATRDELGGPVGGEIELGVDRLAPDYLPADYLRDEAAMYDSLGRLLGPYAASLRADELTAAARTYAAAFARVAEAPLLPYYHHLGRDWFEWIESLAERPT